MAPLPGDRMLDRPMPSEIDRSIRPTGRQNAAMTRISRPYAAAAKAPPFQPVLPERLPLAPHRDEALAAVAWTPDHAGLKNSLVAANVEYLRPWLPWAANEPVSLEESVQTIEAWQLSRLRGDSAHYGLWLGTEPVGGLGILRKTADEAELGYFLARDRWGTGLMSSVVARATDWLLSRSDVSRVIIAHDERNARSGAIPERLGFHRIQPLRDTRPQRPDGVAEAVLWWWARATPIRTGVS